jgi:hypothetical protein
VLSSHCILAVLADEDRQGNENVFQSLGVMRTVAQKVLESIGADRPAVARPAREARDLLRQFSDDTLQGLF